MENFESEIKPELLNYSDYVSGAQIDFIIEEPSKELIDDYLKILKK